MAIEKAIRSILIDDSAVKNLVSTRVYPIVRREGSSLPAIVYQQITGARDHVMSGPSGFVSSRFQINCWADTYAGADELADAVRIAFDGYDGTKENVVIQCIHVIDEGDMPVISPDNEALNFHGKRLDIMVWFDE
jgi:hypothetical protein